MYSNSPLSSTHLHYNPKMTKEEEGGGMMERGYSSPEGRGVSENDNIIDEGNLSLELSTLPSSSRDNIHQI